MVRGIGLSDGGAGWYARLGGDERKRACIYGGHYWDGGELLRILFERGMDNAADGLCAGCWQWYYRAGECGGGSVHGESCHGVLGLAVLYFGNVHDYAERWMGCALDGYMVIKKKPLPEWAAVSYCRGPFPRKLKEPWQRLFTVCVCLQSVSRAWPVRVTLLLRSRIVISNIFPTSSTSRSLPDSNTR